MLTIASRLDVMNRLGRAMADPTRSRILMTLLDGPSYTRPPSWRGLDVPDVLLSGDHARVAAWRHEQSLQRTRERRPDLLG